MLIKHKSQTLWVNLIISIRIISIKSSFLFMCDCSWNSESKCGFAFFLRPWISTFTQLLSKFWRPSIIEILQQSLNGSHGLHSHKTYSEHKEPGVSHQSRNPKVMFQVLHQEFRVISVRLLLLFSSKSIKLLWDDIFLCLLVFHV